MLKSEDFQLTDFSKTTSFKIRTLFTYLWIVGFTVLTLITHAHALTGCKWQQSRAWCQLNSASIVLQ